MITEDHLEQLYLNWSRAEGYGTLSDTLLPGELSAGECDHQIGARP
jgi:hypothetical protein